MTRYRVAGTLLASYAPHEAEPDLIDLDLIVPGRGVAEAEYRVLAIVAPDYDWRRWATRPTIEEVDEHANS